MTQKYRVCVENTIEMNKQHIFGKLTEEQVIQKYRVGIKVNVIVPQHDIIINDTKFNAGDFIEFDREEGAIQISNPSTTAADIILFGGEKYNEPIVAQGPFVMNTHEEIAAAYNDFHSGKYGKITYN